MPNKPRPVIDGIPFAVEKDFPAALPLPDGRFPLPFSFPVGGLFGSPSVPAHIALLVLFAALLHATWNTIVKGGENKLYESALNALGGGLGALCLVPFLSFPASAAWPFLGLSCCCHLAYYVSIAEVYKVVDLSVGYTIMRGSAPLFTAVAMVSLGTSLSPAGWGGLLAICSGIACLALQGGPSRLGRHGLWLVLRTAFIIMGYTLSDGFGGQRSGDSVGYACWIFVLNIFPLHAVVLARSGRDYLRYARKRALPSLGGGLCGLGSYGIAIWAMSAAPIALVAALRETSVVFGMLLAVLFLGERFSRLRAAAVALVAAGAMLLKAG